ncbi:MAG: autotransporter outer membrane beta-barrel domain-containing protein [Stenotrophomonas maltophilia]|uniref:autotransporter family protein n=1 Tax=Stenotrophomonas TaxID=40323 RepID=UPI001311D613|nr:MULTISPECIES: autotransporter outer membrane beta-barrel domain-containing protein [Stenotrophomonas]MBS4801877.1 autotransporter outer membrane beta-barrel domain-containing protein [Stenotrophomonas maltophilia]MDG9988090.1 autotransporter outer membrane beta-barrel domain-containing protein [Stenotrophomonas sp. GD04024]
MHASLPPRRALSIALSMLLFPALPALAQQVVADGDDQIPAAGDYTTTDPVEPGNPAGYAFHALNGGTIVPAGEVNLRTEGMRAAAVRVEGAGSHVALTGGSIVTTGYGAAGVSIAGGGAATLTGTRIETEGQASFGIGIEGGTLEASNVHIITRGGLGHGVSVRGGDVQLRDSVVETHNQASGLVVSDGSALIERVRFEQNTSGNAVMLEYGGNARATLRDVQINGTGAGASGVSSGLGSQLLLENVDVNLTHERAGAGLYVGGDVEFRGGRIHTAGANGSVISFATGGGGSLLLDGVVMDGTWGVGLRKGSYLDMRNSQLEAEKSGIDLGMEDGEANIESSSIVVRNGVGVSVLGNSKATVHASAITTGGDHNPAVAVYHGDATLSQTRLHTTGMNAHALHTFGDNITTPSITASHIDVLTEGESAYGATARKGGTVHLADSVLRTRGEKAHGVLADGRGEMNLTNTHVITEGEGAWAAAIVDGGRLQIDGGALVSEKHGGIWVRSSRDPGLNLANGAVVSGGNGIALALDAAVAGRFDVKLDSGALMIGDIVITPEDEDAGLVPQSEVHVQLTNNAGWFGASHLVQGMALDGGSQWVLNGNATVQDLAVRNSQVALSDGSGRFNVLTVDGDLHSEGATFLFNGALAGDTSDIDRLHVRGDASGDASIVVNNIGGVGAATFDGIPLIRIDGASLADYSLAGRAVGGAYEYFLFKGGLLDPNDGNWYLRSQWFDVCEEDPNAPGCVVDPGPDPDPVDPIDPIDPVDPITPPPVLRPEAGAYLANQSAAVNMFAHRLSDRMGAVAMGEERAAWARVARSNADFTAVGGQLSVDGNTSVMQIGTDVWRRGNAALGVMLGSGRADNTVVSDLTGYSAKGRVRGTAVGVYGTWLQQADGSEGAYVDAQLQYARFSNRVQGVALDRESYDSRTRSASLEGGYTFNVWQGASSNVYVQPQMQLTYTGYSGDRHVERNGTVVDGAEAGGLAGRVGVRAFGQRAGMGTLVQPYLGVNWLRSSGRNAIDFRGETLRTDLPRNRYEVQAGAELKISQRLGAWGGLSMQRGDHGYRDVGGQVGVRLAW